MDDRTLKRVLDAFNRHDLHAIMSFFTDDYVLHMPRGPAPSGKGAVGKDAVKISRKDSFWKIVERE